MADGSTRPPMLAGAYLAGTGPDEQDQAFATGVVQQLLAAGAQRPVEPQLEAGRYRLRTMAARGGQFIQVTAGGPAQVRLRLSNGGWPNEETEVGPTPQLTLVNETAEEQLFILERMAWTDQATTAALERGRFELNCPAATATVLSQELVQPPTVGFYTIPITRSEYTVGVEGCGQRATYVVVCPQGGGGCFAAAGSGPANG